MATLAGFDAGSVEPSQSYELLPTGWYEALITESEMKDTKSGKGQYLELTFEIISGDHKTRRMWARLNLSNPNTKAVEIAEKDLSAICRAVDVYQPQDSEELHGKPLQIRVVQKKRKDTGELENELKGYKKIGDAPKTTQASAAKSDAPPWQQR